MIRFYVAPKLRCRAGIMDQLAAELGISYRVLAADLDERALGAGAASPSQLVMLLAKAKAAALLSRLEAALQPGGPDCAGTPAQTRLEAAVQPGGPPASQAGPGIPAPCSSEAGQAEDPHGLAAADTAWASARSAARQAAMGEPNSAQGAQTAPGRGRVRFAYTTEGKAAAGDPATCRSLHSRLGAAALETLQLLGYPVTSLVTCTWQGAMSCGRKALAT